MKSLNLRPYQEEMVEFIIDTPRCNIWAGMGMGKTTATLTAISWLHLLKRPFKTLVVAPLRVARSVWPVEVEEWHELNHLTVSPILGNAKQRLKALHTPADIYTINYENIRWLVDECMDDWPFECIVADESTKLKNHRLSRGALRPRWLARVAYGRSQRWINLTGTPAPNGVINLWGQQWFVDKGARLGHTFTAFRDRWFEQDWSGFGYTPRPNADREIKEKVSPVTKTLRSEDHFDIKEPIVTNIGVELPKKAKKFYKEMEKKLFVDLGDDIAQIEAFNAASRTMKCLQIANGFLYDESKTTYDLHRAKLDALHDIIEEANGAPVLVAYHFQADLDRLMKEFPTASVLGNKADTIKDWNKGRIPILFAHPASAGHGLNLQHGGNILVFYSLWWDLEQHQQIIERIGPTRQVQAGYNRNVFIYNILAKDTLDHDVNRRLQTKKSVQEVLMEKMESVDTAV